MKILKCFPSDLSFLGFARFVYRDRGRPAEMGGAERGGDIEKRKISMEKVKRDMAKNHKSDSSQRKFNS